MGILLRLAQVAYRKSVMSLRKALGKIPDKAGHYQLTKIQQDAVDGYLQFNPGRTQTVAAHLGLLKELVDNYLDGKVLA